MYKWERTFSHWLLYVLAALMLTACGSGDGDGVLPVNGVSSYQLALAGSSSTIGASGSATLTATVLTATGTPVTGASIAFSQTGAGSLSATTATTNSAGVATITIKGTATSTGTGSVTALYRDPNSDITSRTFSYTITSGDQVILVLDKSEIKTGSGSVANSVLVTAKVTDSNGAFVAGKTVTFQKIGTGDLLVNNPITDANGSATATFSAGSDRTNRTAEIIATTSTSSSSASSLEGRATIGITGTKISLSSNLNNLVLGDSATITATVVDGNNAPISGASVLLSSSNNNTITPGTTATTNSSGTAIVNVAINTAAGGTETVTATSTPLNSQAATITFSVTGTQFGFTAPAALSPLETRPPALATPVHTISVKWLENATPQVGKTIIFSSTRGVLSSTSAITNASGVASVTLSSTTAGSTTIEARDSLNTLSAKREVIFIAPNPTQISIQPSRNVLSPKQQTAVTATIRDALNNPVQDKIIAFSLIADDSGGSLSAATAKTDAGGNATINFTAGPSAGQTGGIEISATVQDVPLVTTNPGSNAKLTVGGNAAFITLGTGNTMREVNESTYALPYTVLLTNSAGQPIANTEVTLSIVPVQYFKGIYTRSITWTPVVSASCGNEDLDRDGILDPNENDGTTSAPDDNNDGLLWPGNVVTVSAGTVTTNASGFANFEVLYPQQYGSWLEVELSASTLVAGTESVNTATFVTTISVDDAKTAGNAPPGRSFVVNIDGIDTTVIGSPYGNGTSCLSTN